MLHFVVLMMCICEKYFHSSVYRVYKNCSEICIRVARA